MKNLLVFLFSLMSIIASGQAHYNPANGTPSNKSYAPSKAVSTDFRTQFYDSTLGKQRDYNGTAEVLTYLNLDIFRQGGFPICVNIGGTLNGNGTFTGGTRVLYWFKDGFANGNLVSYAPVIAVNGQTGTVITKNADSLKGLPFDTTFNTNGYVILFDKVGKKFYLGPNGSIAYTPGTGIDITAGVISALNTTALWNANQLRGRNIATSPVPVSGNVLKYDGIAWAPAIDKTVVDTIYAVDDTLYIVASPDTFKVFIPNTGGINQLTGDAAAGPGTGSQVLTFSTVNSNVGSFTNANITVNAKGLVTAASNGNTGDKNSNIGLGFRWAVPNTNNIKTLFEGYGIKNDTTSNTNGITQKIDTATVFPQIRSTIPSYSWDSTYVYNNKVQRSTVLASGDSIYFFGDSYTAGSGATSTALRWTSLLCSQLGALEGNFGIAGSTLEKQIPIDYMGAVNMVDRLNTVPTKTFRGKMLVYAFGLNDLGQTAAAYNTTNYKINYDSVIHYTLLQGWLPSQILIIPPYWIGQAGYNRYASITGNAAPTYQRQLDFIQATLQTAQKWGTMYFDIYQDQKKNDTTLILGSPDFIHPTDSGYAYIYFDISQYLGLYGSGSTSGNFIDNGTAEQSASFNINGSAGLATSGTNRSIKMQATSGIDNYSGITFSPQSGTNTGTFFSLNPKGTGYGGGAINSQLGIFGTDFVSDPTNYEAFLLLAGGGSNIINSSKGGTGSVRPIDMQMNGTSVLKIAPSNEIYIKNISDYGDYALQVGGNVYFNNGSNITTIGGKSNINTGYTGFQGINSADVLIGQLAFMNPNFTTQNYRGSSVNLVSYLSGGINFTSGSGDGSIRFYTKGFMLTDEKARINYNGSFNLNDTINATYRLYVNGSVRINKDSLSLITSLGPNQLLIIDTTTGAVHRANTSSLSLSAALTSTYIGYGDGSNALTGEAAFNYNSTTNTLTADSLMAMNLKVNGKGTFTDSLKSPIIKIKNNFIQPSIVFDGTNGDVPGTYTIGQIPFADGLQIDAPYMQVTHQLNVNGLLIAMDSIEVIKTPVGSLTDSILVKKSGTNAIGAISRLSLPLNSTLYAQTNSYTFSGTTSETSLLTNASGAGSLTIPSGLWVVGKTIRATFRGRYSTETLTPGSLTIRVKIGGTTIATGVVSTIIAAAVNQGFDVSFYITCRSTGASGTAIVMGAATYSTGLGLAPNRIDLNNGITQFTLNTTTTNAIDLTAQFSNGGASNGMESIVATVESM